MLLRRRRIGVAYELCPAERIGLWAQRNLLVLVGGAIGVIAWFLLIIGAAGMMNWLNEGAESNRVFDDGSPTGVAIKLIGGCVIFVLIVTRQAK